MSELEVYMYQLINVTYYDVPTQLALLDSLKSEEIVGNTARQKLNNGEYQECHENVLVGMELESLKIYNILEESHLSMI